ncbi:MAG: acyl-CoA dehydrogenase family protein, partial [Chloroflexi bacterium]|nr:acyl-CoA dehydrogenase family protein [Chloroflexota bacterium]
MDFELTPEQQLIRDTVHDFAQKEIEPIAGEIDQTERFPWEIIRKMAELGLLGLPFPEKYGGAGGDTVSFAIGVEEISRASGSLGITMSAHVSLGAMPFYLFGTEEQKERYLVPLARGDMLGAFGLTEPEAGSDAGAIRTTAVRDGDHWVINGQKTFITSGAIAGTVILTAVTDKGKGTKGISAIVVEKGTPGFTPGRNEDKLGLRASVTSQLFFENCRVPAQNLLGKENDGFRQMLVCLDGGRIGIGAMAVGLAQAALDATLDYSQERVQFGQPISRFQAIQWMLADM